MAYIGATPTAVPLTGSDIEDGTIQLADLSATGTKDATTFLRGDGTFSTVSSDIVKIASGNMNGGSSVSIDGYYSSTYLNYRLIFDTILGDTDGQALYLKVNESGTPNSGSNYFYASARGYRQAGGTASVDASKSNWAGTSFTIDDGLDDTAFGNALDIMIYNPLNTSSQKVMVSQYVWLFFNGSQINMATTGYMFNSSGAVSGLTFGVSSGSFESSTDTNKNNWTLYGYKH